METGIAEESYLSGSTTNTWGKKAVPCQVKQIIQYPLLSVQWDWYGASSHRSQLTASRRDAREDAEESKRLGHLEPLPNALRHLLVEKC